MLKFPQGFARRCGRRGLDSQLLQPATTILFSTVQYNAVAHPSSLKFTEVHTTAGTRETQARDAKCRGVLQPDIYELVVSGNKTLVHHAAVSGDKSGPPGLGTGHWE